MRRLAAGLAAATLLVAAPNAARGTQDWTLDVAPDTAPANVATTFTLTATNYDGSEDLGCLEVTLPGTFSIEAVGDPVASNGRDWSAALNGTTIVARSQNGGGRLDGGESVSFTVRARPTASGQTAWPNHAHTRQSCDDADQPGVPLTVLVTPNQTPAPTPTLPPPPPPTPTPPPAATPRPTPTPRPSAPQPSATPSAAPASQVPAPSESRSDPTPGTDASATPPNASGSPAPGSAAGGSVPSSSDEANGGAGTPGANEGAAFGSIPAIDAPTGGFIGLGFEVFGLLDGTHVWFVPAMTVGVPGLLVILWVALQAVGVLAWLPAVRRMRGEKSATRDPRATGGAA